MQMHRDFIERRDSERRDLINSGIRALHERRITDRRLSNARIYQWVETFENARRG